MKILITIFYSLFLCLNMSHAQSNPLEGINLSPSPAPTLKQLPDPSPTPTPSANNSNGTEKVKTTDAPVSGDGILNTDAGSGKYAEYESICRTREYDNISYQGPDALKAKNQELKIKADKYLAQPKFDFLAGAELLRELSEVPNSEIFKLVFSFLKKKKLNPLQNEVLNGLNYMLAKNWRSARESLLKALAEDDQDVFVLYTLAKIYLRELNFYEATAIYEDLNKLKSNSFLVELCESMVMNSLNAEGELICMQAAKKFPENPYPLIFAGITHRERDAKARATAMFKKSLNLKPTEMGNVCLAEMSLLNNNPEQAAKYFRLSLELSPYSPRAILGLAWSELKARKFDAAAEAFRSACKISRKYEVEVRKAYKKLKEENIIGSEKFQKLAQNCY